VSFSRIFQVKIDTDTDLDTDFDDKRNSDYLSLTKKTCHSTPSSNYPFSIVHSPLSYLVTPHFDKKNTLYIAYTHNHLIHILFYLFQKNYTLPIKANRKSSQKT
jgi:hypothetical protein